MMNATEDEDHKFLLDIAAVGVPLVVGEELPRAPQRKFLGPVICGFAVGV